MPFNAQSFNMTFNRLQQRLSFRQIRQQRSLYVLDTQLQAEKSVLQTLYNKQRKICIANNKYLSRRVCFRDPTTRYTCLARTQQRRRWFECNNEGSNTTNTFLQHLSDKHIREEISEINNRDGIASNTPQSERWIFHQAVFTVQCNNKDTTVQR